MSQDFTLEKLRISEKIDTVNVNLAVLMESHKKIESLIDKHNLTLYGDGNGFTGLTTKIDRLERERKHIFYLWTTVVAAIGKIVHLSFK